MVKKKGKNNLFCETIQQMREMINEHRGSYAMDTMGFKKKNTKVPYNMLMGRRKKLKEIHKKQFQRAKQQGIQYDSSMKLLNSRVMENRKSKDLFDKNKYKYSEVNQGKIGKQKDGFLVLSKNDVKKIYGKYQEEETYRKRKKQPKYKNKNKNKKIHKK